MSSNFGTADGTDGEDSVDEWLISLLPERRLGGKTQQVFNLISTRPERASFAPAAELAEAVGTSVSSVTRLAQRLGYRGWPDLQREMRTRYLSHISALEVSDSHSADVSPFPASMQRDIDSLTTALHRIDQEQIDAVARVLAGAENIYVTAQGSFSSVGHALVHNIHLAGYPVRELLETPSSIANNLAHVGSRDVLVVCSYWRLYDVAVIAAQRAKECGARVIVLADNLSPALRQAADEVLLVPAEGASFFPSLTAGMALQQGIVATLAEIEPARTRASLARTEQNWETFKLLHRSVPRVAPTIISDRLL